MQFTSSLSKRNNPKFGFLAWQRHRAVCVLVGFFCFVFLKQCVFLLNSINQTHLLCWRVYLWKYLQHALCCRYSCERLCAALLAHLQRSSLAVNLNNKTKTLSFFFHMPFSSHIQRHIYSESSVETHTGGVCTNIGLKVPRCNAATHHKAWLRREDRCDGTDGSRYER